MFQLFNVINESTRITSTSSRSIDIFFVNNISIVSHSEVLSPLCSDHCPISINLTFKCLKHKAYKKTLYQFDSADWKSMNSTLSENDWIHLFNEAK